MNIKNHTNKIKSCFEKTNNNAFIAYITAGDDSIQYTVESALALLESFKKPTPGEIFNITDDFPCNSDEIVKFGCKLLKKELPAPVSLESDKVSEMTRSFYSDNKRVSNKKIKRILDWTPKFINYKLGIKDIFNHL